MKTRDEKYIRIESSLAEKHLPVLQFCSITVNNHSVTGRIYMFFSSVEGKASHTSFGKDEMFHWQLDTLCYPYLLIQSVIEEKNSISDRAGSTKYEKKIEKVYIL